MLERSNEVINVRKAPFTKLVLDVSNYSMLTSSTMPLLQSLSKCLAKKVLLTLKEIADIFALGV